MYIYIYVCIYINIYIYNINGINKTTIIYTTLSFMFPQFSSIILMLSKIFLFIRNHIIAGIKQLNQSPLLKFFNKNLFLCRHFETSSDLLFKRSSWFG